MSCMRGGNYAPGLIGKYLNLITSDGNFKPEVYLNIHKRIPEYL